MMRPDITGFFGALMLLFGTLMPLIGMFFWRGARKQLGWIPVRGAIRASEVRAPGFFWHGDFYEAAIEYTYSYRGRQFRGTTVRSLTILTNWRGPSLRRARKYPPGSEVTVFVNAENPWASVLERGGDPYFLPVILGVSAVEWVLGLAALGAFR